MSSSGYHVGRVERSEARHPKPWNPAGLAALDPPYDPCSEVHCVSVSLRGVSPVSTTT